MSRYIIKYINLEKSKRLTFWNGCSRLRNTQLFFPLFFCPPPLLFYVCRIPFGIEISEEHEVQLVFPGAHCSAQVAPPVAQVGASISGRRRPPRSPPKDRRGNAALGRYGPGAHFTVRISSELRGGPSRPHP